MHSIFIQNIWYDLVSNTCLKEELDQKVHAWLNKKVPDTISELPCSGNVEQCE